MGVGATDTAGSTGDILRFQRDSGPAQVLHLVNVVELISPCASFDLFVCFSVSSDNVVFSVVDSFSSVILR